METALIGSCSCIHCKEVKSVKGIFTHVDRAHLGKTHYSSGHSGRYDDISQRAQAKKSNLIEKYNKNPKRCQQCDTGLDYDIRRQSFCSSSCSATYTNKQREDRGWIMSEESRERTRSSLAAYREANPHLPQVKPLIVKRCEHCNSEFSTKYKSRRFCSIKCAKTSISEKARASWPELTKYRAECSFKFNLKDFPEEFNFNLVEEHGWYAAKNRGIICKV